MNTFSHYKSAIIGPPICPDDSFSGEPSDHSVPICYPHNDRFSRPTRNYKLIKHRPLPESGIRLFGQWIVQESWLAVGDELSPSEQVSAFETILTEKLNECFPEKISKFSSHDKPFNTPRLKQLKRQHLRGYKKHGKSEKYHLLLTKFKEGYVSEAKK